MFLENTELMDGHLETLNFHGDPYKVGKKAVALLSCFSTIKKLKLFWVFL